MQYYKYIAKSQTAFSALFTCEVCIELGLNSGK